MAMMGRDKEAIAEAEQAIRLSPRDPQQPLFLAVIGLAHCTAGRYEECIRFTGEGLKARPGHQGAQRALCVSLAHSGRLEEAREVLKGLIRQQPNLSIGWVKRNVPFVDSVMTRYVEGLRKAGLPE